jgi:hypothetical protein
MKVLCSVPYDYNDKPVAYYIKSYMKMLSQTKTPVHIKSIERKKKNIGKVTHGKLCI